MQKPGGDPKLRPVLRAQHRPGLTSVGGRTAPDVDRHIPDRTFDHPDQLALRVRSDLTMKPAQYAAILGHRMVVLHERAGDPRLGEPRVAPGLGKESAWIMKTSRCYQQHIGNREWLDVQSCSPSASSISARPRSVLPRSRACPRSC